MSPLARFLDRISPAASGSRDRRRHARRPAARRWAPEQLEPRAVLSITLPVTSLADAGPNTLRRAIETADAGAASNSYVIDIQVPGTIKLESRLPSLEGNIRIQGLGANRSTVERDAHAPEFRIFYVPQRAAVSLIGLTIANGVEPGGLSGGGVANDGTLAVTYCTFTHNTAGLGGALANGGSGLTALVNCAFSDNSARFYGGGLDNTPGGRVTMVDCTFTRNTAVSNGGGVDNGAYASVTMVDCIFTSNSARQAYGGGLVNGDYATARVYTCTFTHNTAGLGGGAISNFGTLIDSDNTYSGNRDNVGVTVTLRGR
jgi:hypothetical protein